jgi:hypothetical protein
LNQAYIDGILKKMDGIINNEKNKECIKHYIKRMYSNEWNVWRDINTVTTDCCHTNNSTKQQSK